MDPSPFPARLARRLPRAVLHASLLAALALPLAARAWVSLGESDAISYFMDPDSLRAEGQRRRVWRLFEYKEKQPNGVQSGKALIDIDCGKRTYRYLRTMYYAGSMGQGKYLGGMGERQKEHIVPGTLVGSLARSACEAPPAKPAAAEKQKGPAR